MNQCSNVPPPQFESHQHHSTLPSRRRPDRHIISHISSFFLLTPYSVTYSGYPDSNPELDTPAQPDFSPIREGKISRHTDTLLLAIFCLIAVAINQLTCIHHLAANHCPPLLARI